MQYGQDEKLRSAVAADAGMTSRSLTNLHSSLRITSLVHLCQVFDMNINGYQYLSHKVFAVVWVSGGLEGRNYRREVPVKREEGLGLEMGKVLLHAIRGE
jgi:hypothetical protein